MENITIVAASMSLKHIMGATTLLECVVGEQGVPFSLVVPGGLDDPDGLDGVDGACL